MLVSVVVPAYNEENYIRPCLAALASQQHPNFETEIIVVDDGSTDSTGKIAQHYRARVIIQKRCGVARARQAGFEAARGEIIASMDADSVPPHDWLVRLVAAFQQDPHVVGVYGSLRFDGTPFERWASNCLSVLYFGGNHLLHKPPFSGQNFAVRREAWVRVGGFDPAWVCSEDSLLALKLLEIGQIDFRWNLVVLTSLRRRQEGYWNIFKRSFVNYFRTIWLNQSPLPFRDFR